MLFERGPIIILLIAKHLAKFLEILRIAEQEIPVIVRHLVTEVAEQGAVWFPHGVPLPFALGVICFRQTDRNEALGMAGQNRWR